MGTKKPAVKAAPKKTAKPAVKQPAKAAPVKAAETKALIKTVEAGEVVTYVPTAEMRENFQLKEETTLSAVVEKVSTGGLETLLKMHVRPGQTIMQGAFYNADKKPGTWH